MSPRSAKQFQELREESRERILESALVVFARQGYEKATVRQVAQEAGISQGLMYHYFESKEALLRAIFHRGLRDVHASLDAAQEGATPEAQLEMLVRASFAVVRQNIRFWKLFYGLRMQSAVLERLGEEVVEWADLIRMQLEARVRAAGSAQPESEARLLFALIDGISQHYVLDPEHYPLEEVTQQLLARFCYPDRSLQE